jgi:hypothetical protein
VCGTFGRPLGKGTATDHLLVELNGTDWVGVPRLLGKIAEEAGQLTMRGVVFLVVKTSIKISTWIDVLNESFFRNIKTKLQERYNASQNKQDHH